MLLKTMYSFIKTRKQNQEGRIINRQNLNEYLEKLGPPSSPNVFFKSKWSLLQTGYLRSHPLSLEQNIVLIYINVLFQSDLFNTFQVIYVKKYCKFFLNFVDQLDSYQLLQLAKILMLPPKKQK